ncbi:MAG: butyrate kinase [Bacteroidales bacterium]|nr:butyrate kinase [Bacteroidales bacterium]
MTSIRILAINPGSTSTKIAVYEENQPIFAKTLRHSREEIASFPKVADQYQFRKQIIIEQLKDADIDLSTLQAIVGRGGLLKPIPSGVYEVNERMKQDLMQAIYGEHASNLGGLIAEDLARSLPGAKAYITNPVVVDELSDLARIAGHPLFERKSIFHALNQKAVAENHCRSVMKRYEDLNLIVIHLGGGISVGAHCKGKVIDVNQALDGEGPFTPERSGTLPSGDLVNLSFSGKYSQKEIKKMITGEGGMVAYLGTNSAYDAEQRAAGGDAMAKLIIEAMAYQVAKHVGAMVTVLKSEVDGILITGGIAHSKRFVNMIIERIYKLGPVHVYPGEDEMRALAENGLRVIRNEILVKEYE